MSRAVSRIAQAAELEGLADLWFEGWHQGHAAVVPKALTQLRTRENFAERLHKALPRLRVAGSPPLGFYYLTGAELEQFFVAQAAQGTGLAQQMIAEAEAKLSAEGHTQAHLYCAIGNDRAARFYTKCGWENRGVVRESFATGEGSFALDTWRFEKTL